MGDQSQSIMMPVGHLLVIYTPLIGHATVVAEGALGLRTVRHGEDDPGAFERCMQWAKANQ